jgi:hypothetical protein
LSIIGAAYGTGNDISNANEGGKPGQRFCPQLLETIAPRPVYFRATGESANISVAAFCPLKYLSTILLVYAWCRDELIGTIRGIVYLLTGG